MGLKGSDSADILKQTLASGAASFVTGAIVAVDGGGLAN